LSASESEINASRICGVDADLETCLLGFIFDIRRFLLSDPVGDGSGASEAKVAALVVVADVASLVVPEACNISW
jgi:hypothetical protein